ncbi:hypothetical protein BDQ17DRAFT_1366057 [Cyathus striatus]|nr:hypothetical protein BDQ17DRAFT_1366057 [Cyathus striatus]
MPFPKQYTTWLGHNRLVSMASMCGRTRTIAAVGGGSGGLSRVASLHSTGTRRLCLCFSMRRVR